MKLEFLELAYSADGVKKYARIRLNGSHIGNADIVDGGFIPFGARKVIATLEDCSIYLLKREIKRGQKAVDKLQSLADSLEGKQ